MTEMDEKAKKQLKADRKSAKKLLDALGVDKVIVVDDDAVPGPAILKLAIRANSKRLSELPLDVEDLTEEEIEAEIDRWFETLPTAERNERNRRALEQIGVPTESTSELDLLLYLLSSERTEIVEPQDWRERRDDLIQQAGGIERVLVLFDLNLGPGASTEGVELLVAHLEAEPAALAAILTGEVDEGAELDEHERIFGNYKQLGGRALLTSKHSLTGPKARDFLNILRLTANAPRLGDMRNRYVKLAEEAHVAALQRLLALNPRVFEDVIFRSSGAEGAWELDTLERVTQLMQAEKTREKLIESNDGQAIVERLDAARGLVDIAFVAHPPSAVEARRLMYGERWSSGPFLNKLGLPLANGDVFEVNGARRMLLCQPCDLALRSTGKRKAKTVHLVPLEPGPLRDGRKTHKLPAGLNGADDEIHLVLSRAIEIPIDLLDLCSESGDGVARWDVDVAGRPTALTTGISERRRILHKSMERTAQLVAACESLETNGREEVVLRVLGTSDGDHPNVDFASLTLQHIEWSCQRVSRLASDHAEAALTAWAAELARQAHEHDLDRFTAH